MGVWGWGVGFGGWGLGNGPKPQTPNPQPPIPNPQSPYILDLKIYFYIKFKYVNNIYLFRCNNFRNFTS